MYYQFFQSPVGWMRISASAHTLQQVQFIEDESSTSANPNEVTQLIVKQLQAFFRREEPLDILHLLKKGSRFQRAVWQVTCDIPAGKTISYQQLAIKMGDIRKTRAVARALATNPILLLIPCHRVTGKDGKLRGYAGSPSRKQWLLQFEAREIKQLTLFSPG